MFGLIKQEPVAFQAVIQATIGLVMGFGWLAVSEAQMGLILTFTAALLAFATRRAVTPVANPRDSQGRKLEFVPQRSVTAGGAVI